MSVTTTTTGRIAPPNVYRFGVFALAVVIGMAALGARMFSLQVVPADAQATGTAAATGTQYLSSNRGLIYDATGHLLVQNVVSYSVTVTPADLPLDRELEVATRLGSILNLSPIDLETRIDAHTGSMYDAVVVAEGIPVETARFIEEASSDLPGVKVIAPSKRQYMTKDLFAEILGYEGRITDAQYNGSSANDPNAWKNLYPASGYTSSDVVGQAGLEAQYEQFLRGQAGVQTVSLDSAGKPIPELVTTVSKPTPGGSLTLNIDTKEQQLAQKAIVWGIQGLYKVTKGVIIVENPQNGKILAMVSIPSYNDQLFADGISQKDFQDLLTNKSQPLLNKAISAQYAPGSTYKIVTGTAGLDKGFGTTRTLLSSPYIQVGDWRFGEWDNHGWGPLNITKGFAYSSDTFFYQMARDVVGIRDLAAWGRNYGFGQPTGIDLPGEAAGIVPDDAWKLANSNATMYQGDVMHSGIGQGDDVATPLQVLNAYCALANGGNLWTPQIVKSMTDGNGKTTDVQPQLIRRLPTSAENLTTMRLASRAVVTTKHTLNLVDLDTYGIYIAGKTGTAEFGVKDRNGYLPYHEWFVGYISDSGDFSKTDSKLAVLAMIDGANSQGNVATEVVKYYLWLHYNLKGSAFNTHNPGYVNNWTKKYTNPYGPSTRD